MDLSLKSVTVAFEESRALDAVSVGIASGERVAVIGSSGAGKSTLFRALTGSVPATGEVRLGGDNLYSLPRRKLSEVRCRIGTIRQAYDLVPQLSAAMNVALGEVGRISGAGSLGLFLRGPGPDLSRRVIEALASVGLAEKTNSIARDLSGGQQQRVAVARLLVQGPEIVLADEPFSAVDPVTTQRVLDSLLALNDAGATLVVNLHDVEIARSFPRVLALKDGRLVYDGSPNDLSEAELQNIYAGDRARTTEASETQRSRPPAPVTGGKDGISAR